MKAAAFVFALAASLGAASLPALAQGRVYDRNASNNPEIYRQTHPEDAGSAQDLQGRAAPFDRREADRRDEAAREQARRDAARQEAERRQAGRREHDRHLSERRDDARRHDGYGYGGGYSGGSGWGYVAAPPVYYSPPPAVYYNAPPAYYGNAAPLPVQPGDYLPREYLGSQYIVNDWQWRGLSAPPYGYQWVQLGTGYALVVSSTGQIAFIVATQ